MATITKTNQIEYINEVVIGRIYKLLPIYEGKDINSGDMTVNPSYALEAFLKQLTLLETTLVGLNSYCEDKIFFELIFLVSGMKEFKIGQHDEVRSCIFRAIELCKSLVKKHGL